MKLLYPMVAIMFAGIALALAQHQEPPTPQPEAGASLVIWSIAPGMEAVRQDFEQRTNIPVQTRTFVSGAELYKALDQALQRNEGAPDVARVEYAFLPWLNRNNRLLTLSPELRPFFVPWAAAQASSLGSLIAVPQDIGALAYVYRKDIFERYGLQAPRTWAELGKVGSSLASKTKNQVRLLNFDPSSLFFSALVWAQGGRFWTREPSGYTQTLDSVTSRAAMSFWGGLIRQQVVSTLPEYSLEHWNALRSGRLASAIVPTWALGALAQNLEPAIVKGAEFQMVALPNAGRPSSANWGGSSLVVGQSSQYPNAATAFALFAATSASNLEAMWMQEARLPAMKTGFSLPALSLEPTAVFAANPVEVFANASNLIPERFEFAPWLPTADAIYRKLFAAAVAGKISFGQLPNLWQKQTLELAQRAGFAVR
jgi:multiple sugar transport system substrate-binding protein